jgi:hypothetical protein
MNAGIPNKTKVAVGSQKYKYNKHTISVLLWHIDAFENIENIDSEEGNSSSLDSLA